MQTLAPLGLTMHGSALLLSLAVWFADDITSIPAVDVCQREHTAARTYHCQRELELEMFGGWRNQLAKQRAAQREQLWWAFWWVRWPTATPREREFWYGRSLQIRFGWE